MIECGIISWYGMESFYPMGLFWYSTVINFVAMCLLMENNQYKEMKKVKNVYGSSKFNLNRL